MKKSETISALDWQPAFKNRGGFLFGPKLKHSEGLLFFRNPEIHQCFCTTPVKKNNAHHQQNSFFEVTEAIHRINS